MSSFEFSLRTRLVFEPGGVDRLGELAAGLGARRAFLVTDPGLVAAGHVARAQAALTGADVEVRCYDRVRENPTASDVDACRGALGDWPAEVLIGFGGGSSIDVAKATNFVRAGGGGIEDYWGVGKAKGDLLPLIAVPTTAGTGSEVQSFALIEQDGTHQKMACGDPRAAPAIALLDPELTVTQPRVVTACTGLDTIGHAVETAVTRKRSELSGLFSTMAFRLANAELPHVLEQPGHVGARGRMLQASTYAGLAIENSMLGAAHSMANPLTAHHELTHGQAVGVSLPVVVRFNAQHAPSAARYAELARVARLCPGDGADGEGVDALVARLEELLAVCGFARSLADHGVRAAAVTGLAEEASRQWTAQFNPREVGVAEFEELYRAAGAS